MVEMLPECGIFMRKRSLVCYKCLEMYEVCKKNRFNFEQIDETEEMQMEMSAAIDGGLK